jgi:uncharacterized protein
MSTLRTVGRAPAALGLAASVMLLAGGRSLAQAPRDLYQAVAIVTGTDMRSRPIGFAKCLRDVLVKVSGEPRLHDDPRVAPLAAHADQYVTSFSYVDRMAGRPVHDEQGTRDRPFNMTVKFAPGEIDRLLARLGERPWRGPRPVVVPVLAVRLGTASYLLSAGAEDGVQQRDVLADVAGQFGMRVSFPSDARLASWGVRAGAFPSPAVASSPEQAMVAGTLRFDESIPGWVGAWKMRWRGTDYAWGIRGVNYDDAFRDLMRGVVRIASGHGAPD